MAKLENSSIGLRMEIDDGKELQIISRDLVPSIKGAMSVSVFNYNKLGLAYLFVLTEKEDSSGYIKILLEAFARHGYSPYGEKITQNGLNYYLACMNVQEDDEKARLVESIKKSYERAVFFDPTVPNLSGNVDFKAITMDGKELGSEIFSSNPYTIINIWATDCILCMEILPELVKWENELPKDVQVFYLTAEKEGLSQLDRSVLDEKINEIGLNPKKVLLYDNGFSRVIDTILSATPTTLFVNDKGKIVGDIVLGSYPDKCREIANELKL